MNPIVNTQRDSTQSGVDGALSSTPHGTGSIAFRRVWKKPSLGHLGLTTSRVCLWNTFVTIGSARAFVVLGHRRELLLPIAVFLRRQPEASSHTGSP